MAKRRTKRAEARAKRKTEKARNMEHPSGESVYGKKNRGAEKSRGYSNRITSPFYLSPEQVKAARAGHGDPMQPEDAAA